MPADLKVYLDHLIEREDLRYHRTDANKIEVPADQPPSVRLFDLFDSGTGYRRRLRKPDFQRATNAWNAEDCVLLLESVIYRQIVPAVIMWSSENGFDYVLDGGHRISAVIAWLNDDWGQNLPMEMFQDEAHHAEVKRAAEDVRRLVRARIGTLEDYKVADARVQELMEREEAPKKVMGETEYARAMFYAQLAKGHITFTVQWVKGDYLTAERSFLKINKTGSKLTSWETLLVENRDSSFVRAVMSTANPNSAAYYWPDKAGPEGGEALDGEALENRVKVVDGVRRLNDVLFKPIPRREPIQSDRAPFMIAARRELRPAYLAEFYAVTEGRRGLTADTEHLMRRDVGSNAEEILTNGVSFVRNATLAISHLVGPSSNSKSLGIVPAFYFYSNNGKYIRGLLYGFIYWLMAGSDEEVLARKKVFSVYRAPFETTLMVLKEALISNISRKTGSGPEATIKSASFYDVLLITLINHGGRTDIDEFDRDLREGLKRVGIELPASTENVKTSSARLFSPTMKATAVLTESFRTHLRCGICRGVMDPDLGVQHDHIHQYAAGGPTASDNQRIAHPFCNNCREDIEAYQQGEQVQYPHFSLSPTDYVVRQLTLFSDPEFFPERSVVVSPPYAAGRG